VAATLVGRAFDTLELGTGTELVPQQGADSAYEYQRGGPCRDVEPPGFPVPPFAYGPAPFFGFGVTLGARLRLVAGLFSALRGSLPLGGLGPFALRMRQFRPLVS